MVAVVQWTEAEARTQYGYEYAEEASYMKGAHGYSYYSCLNF